MGLPDAFISKNRGLRIERSCQRNVSEKCIEPESIVICGKKKSLPIMRRFGQTWGFVRSDGKK